MVGVIDSVIGGLRTYIDKAKLRSKPALKKAKAMLTSAKTKITEVSSIEGIKQSLTSVKGRIQDTITRVKEEGVSALLEPLKEKINRFLTRKEQAKPLERKPESKLWVAAFGMTKSEVAQKVAKGIDNFLTVALFDLKAINESLDKQNNKELRDPNQKLSFVEKAQAELKFIKAYS